MQKADTELKELLEDPKQHSLNLKSIEWGQDHHRLYCDVSGNVLRPYIPTPLRKRVFELFHLSSHPSAKVTDAIIKQRYVWPGMHKDARAWCRACTDCQTPKVTRHVKNDPTDFVAPDARFKHVHIDIVGPLPTSEGFTYLLTMIDRFSRWPEAVPHNCHNSLPRIFRQLGISIRSPGIHYQRPRFPIWVATLHSTSKDVGY